jgi:hypothetical protein
MLNAKLLIMKLYKNIFFRVACAILLIIFISSFNKKTPCNFIFTIDCQSYCTILGVKENFRLCGTTNGAKPNMKCYINGIELKNNYNEEYNQTNFVLVNKSYTDSLFKMEKINIRIVENNEEVFNKNMIAYNKICIDTEKVVLNNDNYILKWNADERNKKGVLINIRPLTAIGEEQALKSIAVRVKDNGSYNIGKTLNEIYRKNKSCEITISRGEEIEIKDKNNIQYCAIFYSESIKMLMIDDK